MQVFATTADVPEGLQEHYELIDITESVIQVRDLSKDILTRLKGDQSDMDQIQAFGNRIVTRLLETSHPSAQASAGMLTAFLGRIGEGEHRS